ncbi:hypothetical protein ABZ891_24840 [Streptomyces sp. NPDC047023]|uniref:hypothetical protein n=1 Tax=Streptomyces sp. NPDC047023 TaxID=3155139 RepID=UPI0033EB9F35
MTDKEDPVPPEVLQYAKALEKIYDAGGTSQTALAAGIGRSCSTVSRWLSGKKCAIPTEGDIAKILEFYESRGITIDKSLLKGLPDLRAAAQRARGSVHKEADRLAEEAGRLAKEADRHAEDKAELEQALAETRRAAADARTALLGELADAKEAHRELLNKNRALRKLLRGKTEECRAEAERGNQAEANAGRLHRELADAANFLQEVQLAQDELLEEMGSLHELLLKKTKECQAEAERADHAEADAEEAAALRKRLNGATKYIREYERDFAELSVDNTVLQKENTALRTEVATLQGQVAKLHQEASMTGVAHEATQVRRLALAHVQGPSTPQPPPAVRAVQPTYTSPFGRPAPPPERPPPGVADRSFHYAVRLAVPSQIIGFCGALFHSICTVGILTGWSIVAGVTFTLTVPGIIWLTYKWLKKRNDIAAATSVAVLISCFVMPVSGHPFTLVPLVAEIAEQEGTQWAEEFDRRPCNDGPSLCPSWMKKN